MRQKCSACFRRSISAAPPSIILSFSYILSYLRTCRKTTGYRNIFTEGCGFSIIFEVEKDEEYGGISAPG